MTLAQKLIEILKDLDKEEAKAIGMAVDKRTHMIGAVVDRWLKRFPDDNLNQAIADAQSLGAISIDNPTTMIALK